MGEKLRACFASIWTFIVNDIRGAWQKHRWGMATVWGSVFSFFAYELTIVVLSQFPFSPHYKLHHDSVSIFFQLVSGDMTTAKSLMNQLTLYNTVVTYALALIVGIVMGRLLTRKAPLAACIAVLPLAFRAWFMPFILTLLFSMVNDSHGPAHKPSIILAIITTTPVLATAVLGSLLPPFARRAIESHPCGRM